MPYLFDRDVEAAIANKVKPADALKLKIKCKAATAALLLNHPGNHPAHDQTANDLVISMGSKSRKDRGTTPANAPHAMDPEYVGDDWRMVSDNAQHMVGKVSAELTKASALGLDIQSAVVIGTMYKLAVKVWSAIDQYTGYAQDGGRR